MAGGGTKGGVTYGKTDDFGYRVVENPVTVADFHVTVLHQLGHTPVACITTVSMPQSFNHWAMRCKSAVKLPNFWTGSASRPMGTAT
jgi:hypothetical protein